MSLEIIIETINGKDTEIAYIVNEDGTTLSMLKSTYDEQQAALSTPIATDEPATKSK